MDLERIKEIIQLMNQEDLVEIEIEEEGRRIKLRKREEQILRQASSEKIASHPEVEFERAPSKENITYITAPMVGTFYRAVSPDAPPFVEPGETVEVGQTVCIIEAMKLMNEIKSEVKGRVIEILVENGEPVEYGKPLFRIEPIT